MNIETTKVNLPTVVSIVMASFALYFFIGQMISEQAREAKVYAATLDIERDEDVVDMYMDRIANGTHSPNDPARVEALKVRINRRKQERSEL